MDTETWPLVKGRSNGVAVCSVREGRYGGGGRSADILQGVSEELHAPLIYGTGLISHFHIREPSHTWENFLLMEILACPVLGIAGVEIAASLRSPCAGNFKVFL